MLHLKEEFLEGPQFSDLSCDAIVLYLGCLGYCRTHLTDGWIPDRVLKLKHRGPKKLKTLLGELTDPIQSAQGLGSLFVQTEAGWRIRDFLSTNSSREQIAELSAKRAEAGSLGGRPRKKQVASGSETPLIHDPDPDPRSRSKIQDPDPESAQPREDGVEPAEPEQLTLTAPEAAPPDPPRRVFDAYLAGWRTAIGRGVEPTLTDARRDLVRKRLKEHSADALIAAVSGIWKSTWHVENKHAAFEFAIRNADHIEKFAAFMVPVGPPPPRQLTQAEWDIEVAAGRRPRELTDEEREQYRLRAQASVDWIKERNEKLGIGPKLAVGDSAFSEADLAALAGAGTDEDDDE